MIKKTAELIPLDSDLNRGAQLGGAAGALAPPIILDFTK